ncbi:MAG: hypothetical protein JSU70_00735 [Phycisphaerales bacterium]|nr:MAG: hypothetical protein JSU70_00735 [Phycisphaerales bacterium]
MLTSRRFYVRRPCKRARLRQTSQANSTIMGNNQCTIGRSQWLLLALAVMAAVSLCGCKDWPDEGATDVQARAILRDLSRIETVPDPNAPIPGVYKAPPKIVKQMVGGAEEWKLFYFCQYHKSDEIKQIIHEQFATKLFNKKGQETTIRDYTVTSSSATNQLIVRCPTQDDIEAVIEVIEQVDVPPIQVKIDCIISELYADLTMDRETTIMIEQLFGENISLGGKTDAGGNLLPAFPGAALRDPARAKFGLKIGYSGVVQGGQFQTLVDLLVSRGYLKILMNPILETVNGQKAEIQATENVPLQEIYVRGSTGSEGWIEHKTEYIDVVDSLEITPHVFADGFIGLETRAMISAKLAPEGIKQQPILTTREITNKDNRIRHGDSLIIGGIRKSEKRDVIRGVPGLKDIPGLNLLFSSRDFEERAKEVIFIITPTISDYGIPNEKMVEILKRRHESPLRRALHEAVLDSIGFIDDQGEFEQKDPNSAEATAESGNNKQESATSSKGDGEAQPTEAQAEKPDTEDTQAKEPSVEQAKAEATEEDSGKAESAQLESKEVEAKTGDAETGKPVAKKPERGEGEAKSDKADAPEADKPAETAQNKG